MQRQRHERIIFGLSFAGLLFAGYLSGIKLFTETCAFGESCPYFLGLPACYYGFFMYLLLTFFSLMLLLQALPRSMTLEALRLISFVGILFAGYFTVEELPLLFERGFGAYLLGLPTCALGLLFYSAIFVLVHMRIRQSL